jgi:hypothetical protein
MNRRRTVIAAALAAACAVVVSACTSTIAGTPVVGDAAKAATVKVPVIPPGTPTAAATQRWKTISAAVQQDNTPAHAQYGPLPYPGSYIGQEQPDNQLVDCTLGPLVRRATGSAQGFVTAGHCDVTFAADVYTFADPAATQHVLLGVLAASKDNDVTQDSAVLWSKVPADPASTKIGGKFGVAGVMTLDAIHRLVPGAKTPVCIDGAFSGISCGSLINADDAGLVRIALPRTGGDSGGAAFLVDQFDRVLVIGTVQGGALDGSSVTLMPLAPALERLSARVQLDPGVTPMTGVDYSTLVAS